MDIWNSFILGVLQGMTEFLPISSSGHLVIAQDILALESAGVILEVTLHLGTLLAVVVYFSKELFQIDTKYLKNLAIASLPVAFVGFFFRNWVESLFDNLFLVGMAFLFTGAMNYLIDRFSTKNDSFDTKSSFIVGIFQAFAIIPGISRSGSTIFAGAAQGISRKKAAQFSFTLSIPAILGANFLQFASYGKNVELNLLVLFVGFFSAFLSGILAIKIIMRMLETKNLKIFAFYCFFLGLSVLFLLN